MAQPGRLGIQAAFVRAGGRPVRKVERRKARRYTDRLKAVSDRLDRLIADARQLRAQMEAALARDPLYHFRQLISPGT